MMLYSSAKRYPPTSETKDLGSRRRSPQTTDRSPGNKKARTTGYISGTAHERIKTSKLKTSITCTKCSKTFHRLATYNLHIGLHSKSSIGQETQPKKSFSEQKMVLPCVLCGTAFTTRSSVLKHIAGKHSTTKKIPRCPVCRLKFPRQSLLQIHIAVHGLRRPFKCRHCSRTFICLVHLDKHIKEARCQSL